MYTNELMAYLYRRGFAGVLQELAEMAAELGDEVDDEEGVDAFNRLRSSLWRVAIEAEVVERRWSLPVPSDPAGGVEPDDG